MDFAILLVFLILAYTRPFDIIPDLGQYRIMLWAGAVALIASLPAMIKVLPSLLRSAPQTYLMLAFAAMVVSSRVLQGWMGGGLLALQDFSVSLCLFFLVCVSVTTLSRLKWFVIVWIFVSLIALLQTLAAYHLGWMEDTYVLTQSLYDEEDSPDPQLLASSSEEAGGPSLRDGIRRIRSVGFINDPNDFGQALIIILPFFWRWWEKRRITGNTLKVIFPTAIIVYGVFLTHSRGAYVALSVLVLYAAARKVGYARSALVAGIPIAGAIILTGFGGRGFNISDGSSQGRVEAWSAGLGMLKSSPIWGRGYNLFTDDFELTAHNSFVLCFAELGLVGYLIWIGLLVVSLMELSAIGQAEDVTNISAQWAAPLQLSLVAFLAAAFFLSRTYIPTLYILLGLITAYVRICRRADRSLPVLPITVWFPRTGVIALASIVLVYVIVRVQHFGR